MKSRNDGIFIKGWIWTDSNFLKIRNVTKWRMVKIIIPFLLLELQRGVTVTNLENGIGEPISSYGRGGLHTS